PTHPPPPPTALAGPRPRAGPVVPLAARRGRVPPPPPELVAAAPAGRRDHAVDGDAADAGQPLLVLDVRVLVVDLDSDRAVAVRLDLDLLGVVGADDAEGAAHDADEGGVRAVIWSVTVPL